MNIEIAKSTLQNSFVMKREGSIVGVLVSINCTTYNQEEYIADAIESFLMQKTDFEYEILIGEDCSTDNTKKIVLEYVEKYPDKIRMITSESNVGARKNSMRLLESSKGKYIAECEGDDYWIDPHKLQKQADFMVKNPDCTLCFHAAEIVKAPNKKIGRVSKPYTGNTKAPMEDLIFGGGGFCVTASLFYPRRLMEHPPGFYVEAPVGDYPLQMLLASHGYAYYLDECMAVYRSGVKGSWTLRNSMGGNVRGNLISLNEGLIKLLDQFNEYTNYKYNVAITKRKQKLSLELLILKRKKKKQNQCEFNDYSFYTKMKTKMKIMIRCNFPSLFLALADYKDVKKMIRDGK